MKKLLVIFMVAVALVFTGCEQAETPAPIVNVYTPDAFMDVVGFEIQIGGTALDSTDETDKEVLLSALSVSGLKAAIEKVFPTWILEGGNVPFSQEYTIDVDYVKSLLGFIGKTAMVTTTPAAPGVDAVIEQTEIEITLDNRDSENGNATASTYKGDYIIINFVTYVDPNSFEQIVFEYADALDESGRGDSINEFDGDDVRRAVESYITGYTTFIPSDKDEDDLDGGTEGQYVVFAPDAGQTKYYGSSASLIASLKNIATITYDADNAGNGSDEARLSVVATIDSDPTVAIEKRTAAGSASASGKPSLIVKITPRKTYTTPSVTFTASGALGFTTPSNLSVTNNTLALTTSGTYSGALVYEVTKANDSSAGKEGIGTMTITEAQGLIEGAIAIGTLPGAISGAGGAIPTSGPASSDGFGYTISSVDVSAPSYSNQPDYESSTIDDQESISFKVTVTYAISGRASDEVNAAWYAFDGSGTATREVSFTVTVANNN